MHGADFIDLLRPDGRKSYLTFREVFSVCFHLFIDCYIYVVLGRYTNVLCLANLNDGMAGESMESCVLTVN